jgi:hypothetical protein
MVAITIFHPVGHGSGGAHNRVHIVAGLIIFIVGIWMASKLINNQKQDATP